MSALRILIVGGVAGGASAAAKARRTSESAEIHVFERGPYISFANCGLPYFIGGEIESRDALLLATPETFKKKYRIQVHTGHEVTEILRDQKAIRVRNADGMERLETYDKLILSQGATPLIPPFPGSNQDHVFTLRSIPDMDRIDTYLREKQPETAIVIGGGFIGLEMAEAFHRRGLRVTIVEKAPHILPGLDSDMAYQLESELASDKFRFITGSGATEILKDQLILDDGSKIEGELVLMSIGVRPELELATQCGLEIGKTGGVRVNSRMQSADPHIFVVGDMAETFHRIPSPRSKEPTPVRIPLAGPANRQGRIAGSNAAGGSMEYQGAQGTAIVRVFDWVVGMTGFSSQQATEAGYDFGTSMTRDFQHAGYFPGANFLITKIIFEKGSGKLLGAQVLGKEGVDKRVDIMATAIAGHLSVRDLESLDLAYSPPFGAANDPANIAGFVATNIETGVVATVSPDSWFPEGEFLLDVRELTELLSFGKLAGAVHIPLGELRDRYHELPHDQEIILYCQKGQRGYLATRILMQSGFPKVKNLQGGFLQARSNKLPIEKH
jgi:NADPH-dependent 2,4-dienoyl-CoA reductase/sulfur reductase-like enzyme/rhodanese-related sulfurtransferase